MADIQTATGKQWLSEFQGSENRMHDRIVAIEDEITQVIKDKVSSAVADVVTMQEYINTYFDLTDPNEEQKANLKTDWQTLDIDIDTLVALL